MFQIYQKYFNNNQYGYLLKYDGERDTRKYTIRVFDQFNHENVYGRDTDNPKKELESILSQIKLNFNADETVMYSDFDSVLKSLLSKYGDQLIFSLFFKGSDLNMSIDLQLLYNNINISYNSNCMTDINSFIEQLK